MRRTTGFILLALLGQNIAHAQSADDGSVSNHVSNLLADAKQAAQAVGCGFRGEEWERNLRERIRATLEAHAGAPYTNSHTPSETERAIALRALDRTAAAGRIESQNDIVCDFVQKTMLADLDDIADGATALWPQSASRTAPGDHPVPAEQPRLDWVAVNEKGLTGALKTIVSAQACKIEAAQGPRSFFLAALTAGRHLTRAENKMVADWIVATDFGPADTTDCAKTQATFDKLTALMEGR